MAKPKGYARFKPMQEELLKLREENALLIKSLVNVVNHHKACSNKSFIDENNLKEAELLLNNIKNESK